TQRSPWRTSTSACTPTSCWSHAAKPSRRHIAAPAYRAISRVPGVRAAARAVAACGPAIERDWPATCSRPITPLLPVLALACSPASRVRGNRRQLTPTIGRRHAAGSARHRRTACAHQREQAIDDAPQVDRAGPTCGLGGWQERRQQCPLYICEIA